MINNSTSYSSTNTSVVVANSSGLSSQCSRHSCRPEYTIPRTHCIFLVLHHRLRFHRQFRGPVSETLLTFELLTSYFFSWQFALVTVGRASLPNQNLQDREDSFESRQLVNDYSTLVCWLRISSGDGLHLWMLGALLYLTLLDTAQLKSVEVQTEYLDYFTRYI